MRQAGEPTVEEILASIKQVIARDNRTVAAVQRRRRATEGVSEAARDADEDVDVLDLTGMAEVAGESAAEPDDEPEDTIEALVNDEARASMRDSLAALAMLSQPSMPPQIVRSGETSLEGLVRELLRPALADWLDKNLPPMVEKLVAAEIARIVGKKG